MSMLEVKDLKVYYGMIQAIKGVSFHVDEGEVIEASLVGAEVVVAESRQHHGSLQTGVGVGIPR